MNSAKAKQGKRDECRDEGDGKVGPLPFSTLLALLECRCEEAQHPKDADATRKDQKAEASTEALGAPTLEGKERKHNEQGEQRRFRAIRSRCCEWSADDKQCRRRHADQAIS